MYVIGCSTNSTVERGALSGALYLFNDRANGDWHWDPSAGAKVGQYRAWLPYGISTVNRPPSVASYGGRLYITGWGSYNMVLDEHHRLWKQGIRSPEAPPAIAGAAGTGAIGYIAWYDEYTGERSSLSQGTVISTAVPRTWTLPSRPPDDVFVSDGQVTGYTPVTPADESARTFYLRPGDRVGFPDLHANISYNLVDEVGVSGKFTVDGLGLVPGTSIVAALPITRATHCELWLSVAGGLPRLVMRVPVGTTSVVESTATGDLGESFFGAFERFPRCSMNTIWNDRQLMAGDPDNPDTVYMSELFLPERWAGLSFRTRDGAPVTGLLPLRDFCLVFSRDRTYMLQGYTESDFSFQMIEQSLGSIGHRCNSVVHGSAYVWTEKGPFMFNGSWHPLSPDNIFTAPSPAQNTAGKARAMVDPDANTFTLISSDILVMDRYLSWIGIVPSTYAMLVFDYTTVQPEAGGTFAPARLSVDTQSVTYKTVGNILYPDVDFRSYYLSNKWGAGRVYTMTQSDTFDTNYSLPLQSFYILPHKRLNDAPEYAPSSLGFYYGDVMNVTETFYVAVGHYYFDDIGGSALEGKTFKRLWLDARAYVASATLNLYPGDDDALELRYGRLVDALGGQVPGGVPLDYTLPIHFSASTVGPILNVSLDRVSGRGLSLLLIAPSLAGGGGFRGFGGAYIEGPATRYGLWADPI
jgi:hypothetical protein